MEETPSSYGHQVYLECVGLDTEEMKKKVEMYFKVRRKSGGGECGPVEAVEGNVYRIAFKLREGACPDFSGRTSQRYILPGGVCVLVRHGDITKEQCDALISNESWKDVNTRSRMSAFLSMRTFRLSCTRLRPSQRLHLKLITPKEEVVRALRAACNKICNNEDRWSHENSPGPVNTGKDVGDITWEYIEGYIERQEVDAIVSHMKDHDPRSTGLGNKLSDLMGPELDAAFRRRKENKPWMPVEVNVESRPELRCRHVFFVNLLPWDEQRGAAAVQQARTPSQTAAGALFHGFTLSFDAATATAKVGGVTLQIVHGDIVKEKTDWIVNIIHERKQKGVSKAILNAAGVNLEKEFDVKLGTAGEDHRRVCDNMLDGFEAALKSMTPVSLSLVRVVVKQRNIYEDFRMVLQNRCEKHASQQGGPDVWDHVEFPALRSNAHGSSSPDSSSDIGSWTGNCCLLLPAEWEERWRREKERRRTAMEGGGEGVADEDRRELRRITDYNDARILGRNQYQAGEVRRGAETDVYAALRGFQECSLLTDLTLTQGGSTQEAGPTAILRVHSPVLAAVSSLVCDALKAEGSGDPGEIRSRSLSLGPELDPAGLRAVVEFAYSGDVAEQMKASLLCVEQLWEEGVGCDVVLDVDGTAFRAHRAILAASSEYFRGMFTCGMMESRQPRVSLLSLPPSELGHLISYSYRGILPLGWGHVFEVASAALRLQFAAAFALCLDFMRQEMTTHACLDVASFARAYDARDLLADADDFVLRNFAKVSASPAFPDLPAERLLAYLSADALAVPAELCAFRAAASWLWADPGRRLAMAPVLMREVRFPLMTFQLELYAPALAEFSADLPLARRRVRRPQDALVLVGGDRLGWDGGQRVPSCELWFANTLHSGTGLVKDVEWRRLGELPDGPRFRHTVGVVRGRLHVVGGCDFYAPDNIMKSAYSYDPVLDCWRRLADMQESRSSFTLSVCGDDLLYAIGGDRQINTNVASVEVYDQQSDSWSYVCPLDRPLSGQAAVHLVDGEILVSGGFDRQYLCLASTFLYRPDRAATPLAAMGQERAQHCMEALRDGRGRCRRLYVAGGVCNLRAFYGDQLACETYDPAADAWTAFSPLPVPHVGAASAVLEDKVYVLGGYHQEDYRETGLIHRYDQATGRWQNMGRMPGAVTDVRACLLRLPGRLRR
ncbi:hypothetical protein NHX12_014018 [Muraenolepis orangiensis]|uniref:BTB domain-containing protein n=1 Tax=Muraenolepis orangiensis TaxID=630683 RepID=A0A9Q0I3C8_9TELE|nr:hypothetical protein NHX12_014018 [Muraenolepis orangiensis]